MGYERLSAQDAVFLHIESELQPAHVGGLALLEAGPLLDDARRFRLADVRRRIAGRLHLVPPFRQKVMFGPLEQGRPVWARPGLAGRRPRAQDIGAGVSARRS
ncbi:MAG: wax ester/triacylglycerol synthase domain-containing protein [Acidimicrobiales bacterium]